MRLCIVLSLLTLFNFYEGIAQVNLGVAGGANIGTYTKGEADATGADVSGSATLLSIRSMVEIGLAGSLSLRTGVGYIQRGGSTVTHFGSTTTDEWNYTWHYVEFPVTVKYSFGSSELKPYFFGGFNPSLFLAGAAELKYGGSTVRVETRDLKGETQTTNLGLEGGIGLAYLAATKLTLVADVGYTTSLLSIGTNSKTITKTRDIRLQVGVMFGL